MEISKILIGIDKISNFVPLVSTLTNLVDLFEKCVVLPILKRSGVDLNRNRYFSYINQKEISKCLVALLPLIGNIAIATFFSQKQLLKDASEELKGDRDFVIAADENLI